MTLANEISVQAYQLFIPEALELLGQIEQILLNFEQDHSMPKIQELVRAAHTIKGGAAQVNLTESRNLAAHLEKIFGSLRQENLEINAQLVRLLMQAYECLQGLLIAQIEEKQDDKIFALAQAEPIFAQLDAKLRTSSMVETEIPTAAELGVDVNKFILTTEVASTLENLEQALATLQGEELLEELAIQIEVLFSFGEFLGICELVDIAKITLANLHENPQAAQNIGQQALESFRTACQEAIGSEQSTKVESNLEPTQVISIPCLLEQIPESIKPITEKLFVWQADSTIFTLPYHILEQHLISARGQTVQLKQQRFLLWREQIVPIYKLSQLLNYNYPLPRGASGKALAAVYSERVSVLVIRQNEQIFALESAIDRLIAESELAIEPFSDSIAHPSYLFGCARLDDDCLIPAIDAAGLINDLIDPNETNQLLLSQQEDTAQTSEVSPTEPSIPSNQPPTLLIVDDSQLWRQTLSRTLQQTGYQVLSAEDGKEALKQLEQNSTIQGIISDLEMPNLNGFELLCHRLQAPRLAKIPAIVLSSCNSHKHRQLAKQLGANAYLTKPYKERELLAALQTCLTAV